MENNLKGLQGIQWLDQSEQPFKAIVQLDIQRDFLELLPSGKKELFKKEFAENVKSISSTVDDPRKITDAAIEKYFNSLSNPLDTINELRKKFGFDYVDTAKTYKIPEIDWEPIVDRGLEILQKAIINIVNGGELPKIRFSNNDQYLSFELERTAYESRLHIVSTTKDGNFENSAYLSINERDKSLDNIARVTNVLQEKFFKDYHDLLNERLIEIHRKNIKSMWSWVRAEIPYDEFKTKNLEYSTQFQNTIQKAYQEKYWYFPDNIRLLCVNFPSEVEEGKFTFCIDFGNFKSQFKHYDEIDDVLLLINTGTNKESRKMVIG